MLLRVNKPLVELMFNSVVCSSSKTCSAVLSELSVHTASKQLVFSGFAAHKVWLLLTASKEAAWAFITYMTSKLKAKEYVQNGGVPTRTSVYSDKELVAKDPSYPVQLQALSCASALVKKGIAWLPPTSKLDKILDRAGYYGNLALTGEITPEDACKKAQVEIEDIMSE